MSGSGTSGSGTSGSAADVTSSAAARPGNRGSGDPTRRRGLIAGQGRLPMLVAEGMRAGGYDVHAVGLAGQYDPRLPDLCTTFRRVGLARPSTWIRVLRRAGVDRAVMVGGVSKQRAHDPMGIVRLVPDLRALKIWYRRLRHDRRNAAVLAAIADELAREGITLIDSTTHISSHMATEGAMGRVLPSAKATADIAFGVPLLRTTCAADIGQSMAVNDRDVLAVEAVEGTAAMIERAGVLCRATGWTLLKTAKDDHDNRADVPTIGVETVRQMAAAGGGCIAVGAGRVILIDRDHVIAAANEAGIALVGFDAGG